MAADKVDFEPRRPPPISKDMHPSESPIPLSPQWLLSKPGENKSGSTGDNHGNPPTGYSSRTDFMKAPGLGEGTPQNKKKDVFRPSVLDMDSGRRDRWRDEERDTNSAGRKDRWREGDKEPTDNRKTDRWTDSSGKNYGEARRGPNERWTDSGNKESNNDQRRESKWNSRWGPDAKEMENVREKWADSSKDSDFHEKNASHVPYYGRDEKETDNRPWRMNSSQGRGKTDPPHYTPPTPNRHAPVYASYGRGRGESNVSTFSLGRANSTSNNYSHLQPVGSFSDKGETFSGESLPWRYSKTKLLEIFRTTDTRSPEKFLTEFVQVQALTQEETIEPLALCSSTAEELMILKGIEKGEVVSSGAPQITRDGSSMGKNPPDFQQRRNKLGSFDDLPLDANDSKEKTLENAGGGSNYSEHMSHDQHVHSHGFNAKHESTLEFQKNPDYRLSSGAPREDITYRKSDDMPVSTGESIHGSASTAHGGPWRPSSFGERKHSFLQDNRELPGAVSSRAADVGWSDSQYARQEGPKWRVGEDPGLRRQPSAIIERDQGVQRVAPPAPEDLILYYKDPQGLVQGPFIGSDIIGWFEAGYFGIDLLVRIAGSPSESPFCLLGDVMPHLRAKVRPPPGFGSGAPKLNEVPDASSRFNFSNLGNLRTGSGEIDVMHNESRYNAKPATEAENRFIESLMSGAPHEKSVLSEGMRGYFSGNTNPTPPLGAESAENAYLLAKKMSLERQRSGPHSHPWPVRETAAQIPGSELVQDSLPHPRILSSFADNARPQSTAQNVDLMSIFKGLPDRSSAGHNNGPSGWSNFPTQAGLDPLQETVDVHQGQNYPPQTAYGVQQQQRVQPQATGIFGPDQLLSSSISQDPQLLSLLQQQQQQQLLQSQTSVPVQQLNLLDRLLLLKQQQKQEEQQQILLRQQKELLSQMLSEQNPHQRLGEPSYGMLQTTGFSANTVPSDNSRLQPSHEMFKIGSQVQASNLQDERVSSFLPTPGVSHDVNQNVGAEISEVPLPHQVFGEATHQSGWGHNVSEPFGRLEQKTSSMATSLSDSLPQLGLTRNYQSEIPFQTNEPGLIVTSKAAPSLSPGEYLQESIAPEPKAESVDEKDSSISEAVEVYGMPPDVAVEIQGEGNQNINEPLVEKEVIKKTSDKKSKKQKSSKVPSSKVQELKSAEVKLSIAPQEGDSSSGKLTADMMHTQEEQKTFPPPISEIGGLTLDQGLLESNTHMNNVQTSTGQRAWKPAPGFKPKSLLEIQQEEQIRAQNEIRVPEVITPLSSSSVPNPWVGVVANSDSKSLRETSPDTFSADINVVKPGSSVNHRNRKSELHDLLKDAVVAKGSGKEADKDSFPYSSFVSSQSEPVEENNFIEAKDTKKSRKKSAKGKGAASKVSVATTNSDVPVVSSPIDKSRGLRVMQQEKEGLPAIPSGPSLGDFVVWKGESANVAPSPAWSSESGKVPQQTSLRDILKEQGKKTTSQRIPVPTPQKSATNQSSRDGGSSWTPSAHSPAKAASHVQINSQVPPSKQSDDDLFWGPVDKPKQETRSDFPQLGNNFGSKSTPSKANPGVASSRQKSGSGRPGEHPSPSNVTVLKGKKDSSMKYSEAAEFRDWCETECVRLIKTKDTSFLEYCSKQSRQEAEMLLIENLGSVDPDHKFIEKFLNFKDLLPADVLEIAFQSRNDRKASGGGSGEVITDNGGGFRDLDNNPTTQEGSARGGGKKKGKKGKKVSPSVLGFNVVSNRIMMGEIQNVED